MNEIVENVRNISNGRTPVGGLSEVSDDMTAFLSL
jgi:hypothetical protein